jgi:hypothetical protein
MKTEITKRERTNVMRNEIERRKFVGSGNFLHCLFVCWIWEMGKKNPNISNSRLLWNCWWIKPRVNDTKAINLELFYWNDDCRGTLLFQKAEWVFDRLCFINHYNDILLLELVVFEGFWLLYERFADSLVR